MQANVSQNKGMGIKFWGAGLIFSLAVHGGIFAWYFWKPSSQYILHPAAVPIEIALLGSIVAAPDAEDRPDVPIGVEQVEAVKKQLAKAVEPVEVPEPVVKSYETPEPAENIVPPEVSEPVKPKPEPKKEIEKIVEPEPEPQETTELDPQPTVDSENDHSADSTSAPESVNTEQKADQVTAPSTGMLSEHMVNAQRQWQQQLHTHLARHKQYPRQARRRNQQGQSSVQLTMTRDGQVLAVKLVNGSGYSSLDNESVDLIHRAEPLPSLPKEIEAQQLTLIVPINFSM